MQTPYVAANRHRNMVLVYSVGNSLVHYLGIDGCQLHTQRMHCHEFEQEFTPYEQASPRQFADCYTRSAEARSMIPISGDAYRVLRSILTGQAASLDEVPQLNDMESDMAAAEATRRKPDGPVSQVHQFLDKKLDSIKAQTISRKELIDQLEANGVNRSTAVTQCSVWARTNGITFARPTQAHAAKKEKASKARAAKKAN